MTGDRLYQCGGYGMFIPDPDFTHPGSRIPDPKTPMKRSYTEHSTVGSGLNILDPKQCDLANNFDSKSPYSIYIYVHILADEVPRDQGRGGHHKEVLEVHSLRRKVSYSEVGSSILF
jgi:hypothetical protein